MADIHHLEEKMALAMAEITDCVELSIELRKNQPQLKTSVDQNWSRFLEQILSYIRTREQESGETLLKGLSLMNLLKYL